MINLGIQRTLHHHVARCGDFYLLLSRVLSHLTILGLVCYTAVIQIITIILQRYA